MAIFDSIADDWAIKRTRPWGAFIKFFAMCFPLWNEKTHGNTSRKTVEILVDIGAGSGRNSRFLLQYCERLIDLDNSRMMLVKNQSQSIKIQASMTHLPLRSRCVNGTCAIASFHHIPVKFHHVVIEEIHRISIPNAFVCFTVWRFFQPKFKKEYFKQMNSWVLDVESKCNIGDVQIPWSFDDFSPPAKKGQKPILRFYHLFRASEFTLIVRRFHKIKNIIAGNQSNKDNFFYFGYV